MCSQFWPFLFFNFQVCPRVLLDMPCSHPTKYFVGSAGVGPNAQLLSLNSSVWTVGEGKGWAPTQISVQPHIHTISHDNFGESLQRDSNVFDHKSSFPVRGQYVPYFPNHCQCLHNMQNNVYATVVSVPSVPVWVHRSKSAVGPIGRRYWLTATWSALGSSGVWMRAVPHY